MKQLKKKLVLERLTVRVATLEELQQVQGATAKPDPGNKTNLCNGGSLATAWNCIG